MWMHNGNIADYTSVRRELMAMLSEEAFAYAVSKVCTESYLSCYGLPTHRIQGTSDSALCFALFLSQIADFSVQLTANQLRVKVGRRVLSGCSVVIYNGMTRWRPLFRSLWPCRSKLDARSQATTTLCCPTERVWCVCDMSQYFVDDACVTDCNAVCVLP